MLFDVNKAKKQVLQKLVEKDWTVSELAEELGKSSNTVYNHLNILFEQGVVSKKKVEAKTKPKTEYSIENGFINYIAVLPGMYKEKSIEMTKEKQVFFRIWSLHQEKYHEFVQKYWSMLPQNEITGLAVYGSVARGEATKESDIDILIITENKEKIEENYATTQITVREETKLVMAEVYTEEEYSEALEQSQFIKNIQNELHAIYDPKNLLTKNRKKEDNS